MQGLESLLSRLETVTCKLEGMVKTADVSEADHKSESKSVEEFDRLISGPLAQFIEFGSQLTDPIAQMVITIFIILD